MGWRIQRGTRDCLGIGDGPRHSIELCWHAPVCIPSPCLTQEPAWLHAAHLFSCLSRYASSSEFCFQFECADATGYTSWPINRDKNRYVETAMLYLSTIREGGWHGRMQMYLEKTALVNYSAGGGFVFLCTCRPRQLVVCITGHLCLLHGCGPNVLHFAARSAAWVKP